MLAVILNSPLGRTPSRKFWRLASGESPKASWWSRGPGSRGTRVRSVVVVMLAVVVAVEQTEGASTGTESFG